MIGKWTLGPYMALVMAAAFFYAPPAVGLGQISRIIYFHIPTAWVSVLAFFACMVYSLLYLRSRSPAHDAASAFSAELGLIFCLLATGTGAIFAKSTWGAYWNWDPRQTSIFVLLMIYGAYLALRSALDDPDKRARLSAVYAILAFFTVPVLVFVIPRLPAVQSLHPTDTIVGARNGLNMDPRMFSVFMASLIGFTGIAVWLFSLRMRVYRLIQRRNAGRYEA